MKIKGVNGIMWFLEPGNLDKATNFLRDCLGATIAHEDDDMPWLKKYGHKARGAWVGLESGWPFRFEPAEAIDETLPIGKQIKRDAPCFTVVGVEVEGLDEVIAMLRAKGYRVSDKQKIEDPDFGEIYECMTHPKSTFGVIFEFVEAKGKLPEPGTW